MQERVLDALPATVDFFRETIGAHPERDGLSARLAARHGRRRPFPCLSLNHLNDPADRGTPVRAFVPPRLDMPPGPEKTLAGEILGMLAPLDMLNPVMPAFGLGRGTGSLVTAFGIPLDPSTGNSPAFTRPLADVLADPEPDPATAGLMPEMRDRIRLIKDHVPPSFKIGLPNMQGPFNIAHAVLGEDALTAPYLAPDDFHRFLARVATYWLGLRQHVLDLIGPDYRNPLDDDVSLAECSVNLISPEMYVAHVLPQDLRITDALGPAHIHTCSGPHVFHATLDNLPVVATEAGYIAKTTAGFTPVEEALAAIGNRPILLNIGQELPPGQELETIRRDLDLYHRTPRLNFSYTGMHWRIEDRPIIRDLHRRLDEWWATNIRVHPRQGEKART